MVWVVARTLASWSRGSEPREAVKARAGSESWSSLRGHLGWRWLAQQQLSCAACFHLQGMPSGVYDNIYEDLDDSPVSWHITEVRASLTCPARAVFVLCLGRGADSDGVSL